MKYIPKHKRYYCYSCQAYKPVAAPPRKVTVAVKPTVAVPGVRAPAKPVAAPEVVKKDSLARYGSFLIIFAVVLFIISSLFTFTVGSGSMDEAYIVDSGRLKVTFWGDLIFYGVDASTLELITYFNILLFLAVLFAAIGLAMFGLSLAKWLPKIAQEK